MPTPPGALARRDNFLADIDLELGDPPARHDQPGVVGRGRPGYLPEIDHLLAPPGVDATAL
ncbi:MAG TPA: hypothetical protein VGP04_08115 [Pseudonocardiaceae bacterium]|nr:hypothetical protein [Pseudonocardiaceae bacterium]